MAKKTNKPYNKKMGNPAAAMVAVEAVPKVAKAASDGASKANKDTNGALSWVIVGGLAIAGFVVLRSFNKVGNAFGSAADVASSTLDNIQDAINDPNLNASDSPIAGVGNITTTITDNAAQNKANILLVAMDGFGTDFTAIKNALQGLNVADYALIAHYFGTPRYSGFGEGVWPAPKRNLSYWIAAELDDEELSEIRAILPNVF